MTEVRKCGNFESFSEVNEINGFEVFRDNTQKDVYPADKAIILDPVNRLAIFRLRTKPVKVAPDQIGCQQTEMIALAKAQIEWFQENSGAPCRENAIAITKLDEALMWLNQRTKNREKRQVEGTYNV